MFTLNSVRKSLQHLIAALAALEIAEPSEPEPVIPLPEPIPDKLPPAVVAPPYSILALPTTTGAEVIEPDTGITIRCLSGEGKLRHSYSQAPAGNLDGTKYVLYQNDFAKSSYKDWLSHPIIFDNDGTQIAEVPEIDTPGYWWSFTDPNKIFGIGITSGSQWGKLTAYDVSTNKTEMIFDFVLAGICAGTDDITVGGSLYTGDWQDEYVIINIIERRTASRCKMICLLNMKTKKVVRQWTPYTTRGAVNNPSTMGHKIYVNKYKKITSVISPDGKYIVTKYPDSHVEVEDIDGSNRREIGALNASGEFVPVYQGHSCTTIDTSGNATVVYLQTGNAIACDLETMELYQLAGSGGGHLSGQLKNYPGHVLHYNYPREMNPSHDGDGRLELLRVHKSAAEPVQTEVDGNRTMQVRPAPSDKYSRVYGFHRTKNLKSIPLAYAIQPQASVSMDGSRVFFISSESGTPLCYMAWMA